VVTEASPATSRLKTAEGTARQIGDASARGDEPFADGQDRLSLRRARSQRSDKMDPRKVNGAVFLGLEGIVIKSHGGTDACRFRQRDRSGL
jgi:glycerol-3-phosphate acyltransferase PlsX